MQQYKLIPITALLFSLISCKNSTDSFIENGNRTTATPLFVEQVIGKTGYLITIPNDYTISATDGPDAMIYYIYPKDSTKMDQWTASLYFGNHPSEFKPADSNCKTSTLKRKILDLNPNWILYNCNEKKYSIQTIIPNTKTKGWDQNIHVFGNATTKKGLQAIFKSYTSLHLK